MTRRNGSIAFYIRCHYWAAVAENRDVGLFCLPHDAVERRRIRWIHQYRLDLLHDQIGKLSHLLINVSVASCILDVYVIAKLLGFIAYAVKHRSEPWTLDVWHGHPNCAAFLLSQNSTAGETHCSNADAHQNSHSQLDQALRFHVALPS